MNYKNEIKVAIIVLNWNGFLDTCDCVDSVLDVDYLNYQILIVDNGSENTEALRLKDRFKNNDKVVIIENQSNLGYCGGNNVGFTYARNNGFDAVLVLNNDTVVDKKFLRLLVELMEKHGYGAVGVTTMDYQDRKLIQNQGMSFNLWTSTVSAINHNKTYNKTLLTSAKYFSGACFLIDVTRVKKDLFDERLFCYFEEIDLCLNLREEGAGIFIATDSIIYHKGSVTSDSIKGFAEKQMAKNRFLVIKKHSSWLQKITFILFILLFYWYFHSIILIVRGKRGISNIPFFLKGLVDGFIMFIK